MYTRNHISVPAMVRAYDQSHALVHFGNLFSVFSLGFPLSNYTLSLKLAQRIGYWDTCADAIGEDFHTVIKSVWKTKGKVKTQPIFVPCNQVNIETGRGYLANLSARFWQA